MLRQTTRAPTTFVFSTVPLFLFPWLISSIRIAARRRQRYPQTSIHQPRASQRAARRRIQNGLRASVKSVLTRNHVCLRKRGLFSSQDRSYHWHHWAGWQLPRRVAPAEGAVSLQYNNPSFLIFDFCLSICQCDLSDNTIRLFVCQGYEVHGIKRHASTFNQSRIEHLFMHGLDQKIHTGKGDAVAPLKLHMHYGDVLDMNSLVSVFLKVRPDEIYNLAAQSHVRTSFDMPL